MDEQRRTDDSTRHNGERWRVFAAAPINDDVRAVMQHAQNRLASNAWPVRWVDPRLGHLTLRFHGDSDIDAVSAIRGKLQQIAARHESMQLHTGAVGAFPSTSRARVLWLGLDGDVARLRSLAADINADGAADAGTDRRPFKPHVTLARLRNGAAPLSNVAAAAGALELPAASLTIDRIQLIRSVLGPKGPTYSIIDEWPLIERPGEPAIETASDLHEHT
ncbi:MAG TPA: RNA 2',3'-cyclic phosphodiesterase [Thermomicrobiales bacterium]|nr:RNA 2',3'-cyclic phosphodiesterase [Thermomicrobiales bacterium]